MNRNSQRNKARAAEFLAACYTAPLDDTAAAITPFVIPEVVWQGFAPLFETNSPEALVAQYLMPLRRAFPCLERLTDILVGGRSDGTVQGGNAEPHLCHVA